jgi:hypothetical protein
MLHSRTRLAQQSKHTAFDYAEPAPKLVSGCPGWVFPSLVMHRLAADLVVGMEERLGQEVADMGSAQAIDDPTTVAAALDEASKAKLREMLAGHSRTTASRFS